MLSYRVFGLPTTVLGKKDVATSILTEFFGDVEITVRSLALHPQRPSVVSIVTFSSVPECLSAPGPWRLKEACVSVCDGQPQDVQLEVDMNFLGFTPLGNPATYTEEHDIDCIVISGLSSHPLGSWKERDGDYMWLVDDFEAYPPNVRMLLYGYDSSLITESFEDVTDIGQKLAVSVKSVRQNITKEKPRPIVFISHSLGGLAVKEATCYMNGEDAFQAQCIYGLVCFGVPHDGLYVQQWLSIVNGQANKTMIESLEPGSRYLQRLDEKFREAFTSEGSRVISVYETLQSSTTKETAPGVLDRSGESRTIVPPASAIGHWPENICHTQIPVNRSHENLPKFRGQSDPDYLLLLHPLNEIWLNAVADVQKRVSTAEQPTDAAASGMIDREIRRGTTVESPDAGSDVASLQNVSMADTGTDTATINNALIEACENGDEGTVRMLLFQKDIDLSWKDSRGLTALQAAAKMGHDGVVRIILVHKATHHSSRKWYDSNPITRVAHAGIDAIKIMISTKADDSADENADDKVDSKADDKASDKADDKIDDKVDEKAGEKADEKADDNADDKCEMQADVDANKEGTTTPNEASIAGRAQVARVLLEEGGADADLKDGSGSTTLECTTANGDGAVEKAIHAVDMQIVTAAC